MEEKIMNKRLLSLTMSGMLLANSSIASEAMEPEKLKCVGNVVSTAVSNPVKTLLVVGGIIAAPIAAVAAVKAIHRIVKKPNVNVEEIKKEVIDNVKKGEYVKVEAFSANDAKKFKSEMEASGLKVNGGVQDVPDDATGTFIVMPRGKKEGQPEEYDIRFEVEKPAEVKPAVPKHEVKPEIKPEVKLEEKRQEAPKKAVKEEPKEAPKEQPKEAPKKIVKEEPKEEPKKHGAPVVEKLDEKEVFDVKMRQLDEKIKSIESLEEISKEIEKIINEQVQKIKKAREERTGVSDEVREEIQEALNELAQERMPVLSVEEVTGNIKESMERIERDSQKDAERLNQRALEVAREVTGDIRLTEAPESVAKREHAIELEVRPAVMELEQEQEISRVHEEIDERGDEAIRKIEEDARRMQEALDEFSRQADEYLRQVREEAERKLAERTYEIPVAGIETSPEELARMEEELRLEQEQQRIARREAARDAYKRRLSRGLSEEVHKQVNYIMNFKPQLRLSKMREQISYILTRCIPQGDLRRVRTEIETNTRRSRYRLEDLLRGEETGANIQEQMQKIEEILNYAQTYNFNASLAAWEAVH